MGASDVEEATTENRKGWLHVQDEDSPALVLWHAAHGQACGVARRQQLSDLRDR